MEDESDLIRVVLGDASHYDYCFELVLERKGCLLGLWIRGSWVSVEEVPKRLSVWKRIEVELKDPLKESGSGLSFVLID